ncbi:MAG: DUF4233 domain-containing protein [Actinobacteria bacterium]|jgi:hypothetical protein|nr:DUF4233 domain-containing protein [Actinomycetota bacterium]
MRVLSAAVLSMEAFVMGFAVLLAMGEHTGGVLALGGALAIALLLNAGLMKKKVGWVLGSVLQLAMIGYGYVVTPMYFMGALFAALWIAAFLVGRKGEAIRAELLRQKPLK